MDDLSERIRTYRQKLGMSQEHLATVSGLNLRTIQRIEKGTTIPRGDSLRRLAIALGSSPDDLINWKTKEDKNVLMVLNLSQLSFIVFPLLGIILPLIIWIIQKDKMRDVDQLGKSILNFQITLTLFFFCPIVLLMLSKVFHLGVGVSSSFVLPLLFIMYAYNILIVVINSVLIRSNRTTFYKPAIRVLN